MSKKSENPIEAFQPKKFACSRWPFLRIGGGLQFQAGFLTVTDQQQMDRLARVDAFKCGQIVEIKNKPRQKPTIEESAELAALKELEALKPKARRGMVSTTEMVG